MGRKMIKFMASEQLRSYALNHNPEKVEGLNNDEENETGMDLLAAEATIDYLCNISPHR